MSPTGALDPFPRRPRGGPRVHLHAEHASSGERALLAVLAQAERVVHAADERAGYDPDHEQPARSASVPPPASPDPEPAGDLRAALADARAAIERAYRIAATRGVSGGGELGGLVELLGVLDRGQATVLELVDRIETDSLAERRMGLPLESVLALETTTTHGERRFLHTARETLGHLPHVKAAFDDGTWAGARSVRSCPRPAS